VTAYRDAVSTWPVDEMQYVPAPAKFFDEARYEHDEATWARKPVNGFTQEREQLQRLVN
jgi:hypothetical protein